MDGEPIPYRQDAASLRALAAKVRENIRKPYDSNDPKWENQASGLWSTEKGRFINGVADKYMRGGAPATDAMRLIDYGYVYWNLEAVDRGIPNEAQAKDIMDWISGERLITGETSTGSDIYDFKFAPRVNTVRNTQYGYYWRWYWGSNAPAWAAQVQDGGAIGAWTYYDLSGRLEIYGKDNAFERMKEIQAWYEDVASYLGEGENFYKMYYNNAPEAVEKHWHTQGGASGGGNVGLDTDFLESTMIFASVPYKFFGMDGSVYKTILFENNLPSPLKFWRIDNMMYSSIKYSLEMGRNYFRIENARGKYDGEQIVFKFPKPSGSYKIKLDGKIVTDGVSTEGDWVIYKGAFANMVVSIE